jgi:hypothetical protein
MARQASSDTDSSDDELFRICLSGSQPALIQPCRQQQLSASGPLLPPSHQQQPGDTSLDYVMEEQPSFSGDDDPNDAVNDSSFCDMNQDGCDVPAAAAAAAGTPAGFPTVSDQGPFQHPTGPISGQPANWCLSQVSPQPAATTAAVSPADAAALALPWLSKSPPGNSSNSNRSRPGTAARRSNSQSGSPYDIDTAANAFGDDSVDTRSTTDAIGTSSFASYARITSSNSSPTVNLPAAAMQGSSSSCYMIDLEAALLPPSAEAAWQPG